MKRRIMKPVLTIALLGMGLLLLPGMAAAQSSWQWETSLKVETVGDSMYMPSAVAFDVDSERYYVVDTGRNRLVSFDRDGTLIRAFSANEQLRAPFDMVRLDNGVLWVVEKGRNSLTMIDVAAKKIEMNQLMDGDRQVFPHRIAFADGKLHILDRVSGQVLRLGSDLAVEQRFGCATCSAGFVDFVIIDGNVVGLEPRDKKIFRFAPDGSVIEEISLAGELDFPVSLDVGPSGFIYVLDRHKDSVLVYSGQGELSYSFLGTGYTPGKVYFARQLRFDPWGRLCIVDEGNGRVEVFSR